MQTGGFTVNATDPAYKIPVSGLPDIGLKIVVEGDNTGVVYVSERANMTVVPGDVNCGFPVDPTSGEFVPKEHFAAKKDVYVKGSAPGQKGEWIFQ
jgi:hypothetical protein